MKPLRIGPFKIKNKISDITDEEQSIDDDQFTHSNSNKETDIPSTIDFQSEPFSQYSSFPYQQNTPKTNNTKSENQTDIHDYDNFLITEDTLIIDIISAHNHKKTINFSSVKRM